VRREERTHVSYIGCNWRVGKTRCSKDGVFRMRSIKTRSLGGSASQTPFHHFDDLIVAQGQGATGRAHPDMGCAGREGKGIKERSEGTRNRTGRNRKGAQTKGRPGMARNRMGRPTNHDKRNVTAHPACHPRPCPACGGVVCAGPRTPKGAKNPPYTAPAAFHPARVTTSTVGNAIVFLPHCSGDNTWRIRPNGSYSV
jgi:hypothetical protein